MGFHSISELVIEGLHRGELASLCQGAFIGCEIPQIAPCRRAEAQLQGRASPDRARLAAKARNPE